jgi:serine/threonine protein kinase
MVKQRIASQVSQTTIGGYPVVEKISTGGMGTVYKAQSLLAGQFVAIKVLANVGAADEVVRMRFAQECQVARNLNHPHIVRVLDYGLDGSRPFLVMEYVDGESLGQRLERDGRLPEAEAVRLIGQVGTALHWAHQRKLIHRDVKPDNILISASGHAKLTDLGLVKDLDGDLNLTKTQSGMGTPHFMAPEQFEDARRADMRSDLYSLAATLYTAVTGQMPFGGSSAKAVVTIYKKKLANDIIPPRTLAPEVSARLESELLKALQRDRKQRHASVKEFIECLPAPTPPAKAAAAAPAPKAASKTAKRAHTENARTKPRFETRRGTLCKPLQRAPDKSWSGHVLNISETGLCIELTRRYEPGTLLTIVPQDTESGRRSMVARVVWVRPGTPKQWIIGCKFDKPLCDFEVDALR